jgi:hypothetical protein
MFDMRFKCKISYVKDRTMSVAQQLKALQAVLPKIRVEGDNANTTFVKFRTLANTGNTLEYNMFLDNPIRYTEDQVSGVQSSVPLLLSNKVVVKRYRNKVLTDVNTFTVGSYDNEVENGWLVTLTYAKSTVQAGDYFLITFNAPNAVPVVKKVSIV